MRNILIIGDGGVGKTNYINKIIGKPFEMRYIPTEGIHKIKHGDIVYYDYPGQEFYCPDRKIKDIDECWILYRSDSRVSQQHIQRWSEKLVEMCGSGIDTKIIQNEIKYV
jgi:GTPase SAR1 family protein